MNVMIKSWFLEFHEMHCNIYYKYIYVFLLLLKFRFPFSCPLAEVIVSKRNDTDM